MRDTFSETDVPTPNRRELLATGGGLLAGGVAWATVGTDGVRGATVSADSLSIADGQHATPGGEVYSPVVQVTAEWSYAAVESAAQVMAALLIGGTLVDDVVTAGTAAPEDTGTTDLSGVVVDSQQWVSGDWDAPADGDVSHNVSVELLFEVRDADGATLASATATDTPTITVSDSGPELSASVGGDGDVAFLETENGTPK